VAVGAPDLIERGRGKKGAGDVSLPPKHSTDEESAPVVVLAVYDCIDPDTLVLEYTSDGRVTTTGKPYRNSYVGIVRFREGAICFQREYHNPLAARRALTPE
jgi:ketosteroid isomerase-like protein